MYRIVIDTNIVISALMSDLGASFILFNLIDKGAFTFPLSVPLVFEYEAVAKRLMGTKIHLSSADIDKVIFALCTLGELHEIYYLWRPFLTDRQDDMVLEIAVRARCQFIVTHNISDFRGIGHFGIEAITPKMFLQKLGILS